MQLSLALVSAALLAGQATASAVAFNRAFKSMLQARQGSIIDPSDIAPECQTICAPMVKAFNGCTTEACICNNSVMKSTADCLGCNLYVGGPPPADLLTEAQQTLAALEDSCKAAGDPVSSFTISASGTPSSPTSASAGHASIPVGTPATSPSIFFSSATGAPPVNTPTPEPSQFSLPAAQPSHVTISVLPSPSAATNPPNTPSTAGLPTPTGAASGAVANVAGGLSSLVVAGAMVVMAL